MTSKKRQKSPKPHRGVFIYLFFGIVGAACAWILIGHVLAKNRIIEVGRDQREAEHEIADLKREIRDIEGKIDELKQPKNIKKRLTENRTRLRDIDEKDEATKPIEVSVSSIR